jgi:hypothetical protein
MTDLTLPAPHSTTARDARIQRVSDAVVASYLHDISSGTARARRSRYRLDSRSHSGGSPRRPRVPREVPDADLEARHELVDWFDRCTRLSENGASQRGPYPSSANATPKTSATSSSSVQSARATAS